MLQRLRPRSGYDVITLILLFIAVGTGGAYAADTIGSGDVVDESLLSQDIKNGQVKNADIAGNSIGGGKVIDGMLTGADVDESTLGEVPAANSAASALHLRGFAPSDFLFANAKAQDSESLDGKDSGDFVQGKGRVLHNRVITDQQGTQILNIPYTGVLTVEFCDHQNASVKFNTVGTGNVYMTTERGGQITTQQPLGNWPSATLPRAFYHMQLARSTGPATQLTTIELTWNAADCTFAAQALQTPAL